MEDFPMNQKSGKTLLILLIIAGIIIAGLGGYLISEKMKGNDKPSSSSKKDLESNSSKDENSSNDSSQTDVEEAQVYDIEKDCDKPEKGKICIKKINVNGHEEELRVATSENEVEPGRFDYTYMSINGIVIYNLENDFASIDKITVLKDILIVDSYCTNCGGSSSLVPMTKVMNLNGDIIYDLFRAKFPNDFQFEKYKVKNNEIIATASAVGYVGDMEPTHNCYLRDIKTDVEVFGGPYGVNGTNYDKYSDTLVQGEYRIAYLGNGKFSDPIKVTETKFGELYTKQYCIDEYDKYLKEKDNF